MYFNVNVCASNPMLLPAAAKKSSSPSKGPTSAVSNERRRASPAEGMAADPRRRLSAPPAKTVPVAAAATFPEYVIDAATKTTYLKGKFLGKGGFARVYEFTDLTTNIVYAGKIIPKSRIVKPYHKEKIAREIDLHRKLNHENIVKFHHFFSDDESVYIILENCSYKSLIHVLKIRGKLTEPEVRYYLHQLLLGIGYIHKKKVIHRDLKLGNMFLTDDLVMKIGDFGLATRVDENEPKKVSICGTPNYIAPEILKKQELSYKADIWAVGCIMYAMLVGHPPFEMSTLKETYAKITSNAYVIPPLVSTSARKLITAILQADPKNRPDASTILSHDFFNSGYFPKTLPISSCTELPKFTEVHGSPITAVGQSTDKGLTQEMRKLSRIVPKLCKGGSKSELKGMTKEKIKIRSSSLGRNETLCNCLLQKVNNVLRPEKSLDRKSKYSVVSDLLQVLSFVNVMPEEPSANMVLGSASPILFVTKWIDYSNKYGFGFQLCDHSVCMLLNDSARIGLSPDRSRLEVHEQDSKIAMYMTTAIPTSLVFHYKLIKYLAKYMDEKLTEGGRLEMVKRHWPPPHMSWWMRTDFAIIMQLDTGALQVNFFKDHTKLILSKSKEDAFLLTYIDEKQQPKTYLFLQLVMLGCPRGLQLKLECLQELLNHFIQVNGGNLASGV